VKIKQLLFILLLAFGTYLFISCKFNERPDFVSVSNVKLVDYSKENIILLAELVFSNPNHVGGTLQADNIKVLVNDIDMGFINSPDFTVPAEQEFTVPIKFKFSYHAIFKDTENLLQNVLNTLTDRKLNIRYIGTIKYKFNQFYYDYPLDYSQEISLSKNISNKQN